MRRSLVKALREYCAVKIIVLFNLQAGADIDAYEQWARSTDIPGVRAMGSVDSFRVFKTAGLFGSVAPAPYQYAELIEITAMDQFLTDISTAQAQQVADEFQTFADNPVFMLADEI